MFEQWFQVVCLYCGNRFDIPAARKMSSWSHSRITLEELVNCPYIKCVECIGSFGSRKKMLSENGRAVFPIVKDK